MIALNYSSYLQHIDFHYFLYTGGVLYNQFANFIDHLELLVTFV